LVTNEANASGHNDLFECSVKLGAGSGNALENSNDLCSIAWFKGVDEIALQCYLDASGENAGWSRLREFLHKHDLLIIKGRVSIFHAQRISELVL
jgi:hypothetical protein